MPTYLLKMPQLLFTHENACCFSEARFISQQKSEVLEWRVNVTSQCFHIPKQSKNVTQFSKLQRTVAMFVITDT
jgi:hypothetical protein